MGKMYVVYNFLEGMKEEMRDIWYVTRFDLENNEGIRFNSTNNAHKQLIHFYWWLLLPHGIFFITPLDPHHFLFFHLLPLFRSCPSFSQVFRLKTLRNFPFLEHYQTKVKSCYHQQNILQHKYTIQSWWNVSHNFFFFSWQWIVKAVYLIRIKLCFSTSNYMLTIYLQIEFWTRSLIINKSSVYD